MQDMVNMLLSENIEQRRKAAESLEKLGWVPANKRERAALLMAKCKWQECIEVGCDAVDALIVALRSKPLDFEVVGS